MLKHLHFGSVSGKLWPFEDFSSAFFGSKHHFFQKSVKNAKKNVQKLSIQYV
jgi:hypothetical protein